MIEGLAQDDIKSGFTLKKFKNDSKKEESKMEKKVKENNLEFEKKSANRCSRKLIMR